MSSDPKRSLVKHFVMSVAGGAAAWFLSMFVTSPMLGPLNGTVLASDRGPGLGEQRVWCDEDDYELKQVSGENKNKRRFRSDKSYSVHFDASGVIWNYNEGKQPSIIIRANNTLCWSGGVVRGGSDSKSTESSRKLRSNAAMQILGGDRNAEIRIEGTVFSNLTKAINITRKNRAIALDHVWFNNVSDYCVDGVVYEQLTITNSLLDGCRLIMRSNFYREDVKPQRVLRIQNNLIRIATKRLPESGFVTDRLARNNKNLALELYGNVFLVQGDDAKDLGVGQLLTENLTDCGDNVIVWLGSGDYPEWLPDCFSITKDDRVWQRAKNAWIHRHASAARLDESVVESAESSVSDGVDAGNSIESEAGSDAQESLGQAPLRGAALTTPGLSTLEVPLRTRTRRRNLGDPWSDGTLWSDGTGWDWSRGSLVSCRESRPGMLRPMTGATVCPS